MGQMRTEYHNNERKEGWMSGNNESVRMIFPLLRRKDGKPRKIQRPVASGMNGHVVRIPRGVVVEAPAWVPEVCSHFHREKYECFVSYRRKEAK